MLVLSKEDCDKLIIACKNVEKQINNLLIEKDKIKERGHRLSAEVESLVVESIKVEFPQRYVEATDPREIGDVYLVIAIGGVKIPLNIKFGEAKKGGQPNVASAMRLLELIDQGVAYYIVKVRLIDGKLNFRVVNIFEHLNVCHFDAGTGQIMLKADQFYKGNYNLIMMPQEQRKVFLNLLIKQYDKHIKLKTEQFEKVKRILSRFLSSPGSKVV